jgi:putative hemolysin
MKRTMLVVLLLAVLAIGACGSQPKPDMENPASKYCADQGHKWESRTEAGGEVGYCLFDDGSECEEWAYYRGQCGPGGEAKGVGMPNPASVHCADEGGKTDIRTGSGGEVGYCVFDDGSECDEWAFFRGDCAPGENKS